MPDPSAVTVRVPRIFYEDHVGRDCLPGKVVRELARIVVVEMNEEELSDLRSDADYYADSYTARDLGPDYSGLVASARATLRAIAKANA